MGKKVFNVKSFAIAVLRRASYRSPTRSQVLKEARRTRNNYVCADCSEVFPRKAVAVDHKEPVVPVTGWDSFDGFICRLFCPSTGLQVLCKPCHKEKTNEENKVRRENKKKAD